MNYSDDDFDSMHDEKNDHHVDLAASMMGANAEMDRREGPIPRLTNMNLQSLKVIVKEPMNLKGGKTKYYPIESKN